MKSPDDATFVEWQENPEPEIGEPDTVSVKADTTRQDEDYIFIGKEMLRWIAVDEDTLAQVEP